MEKATILLAGGVVHGHPGADALAVGGDEILAIGAAAELSAYVEDRTERIDLAGRFLLPGFIDGHVHIFHTGLSACGWRIDLAGLERGETLERLREAARDRGAGEWTIAGGCDESLWTSADYLQRADLDRVGPDAPMIAVRMDGHILAANSKALAWLESHPIDGFEDALLDVERGLIREASAWLLIQQIEPDRETQRDAIAAAAAVCHGHGITSVHTMTHARRLPALEESLEASRLRATAYIPVESDFVVGRVVPNDEQGDPWLRIGGAKIFADGSIGAQNAAVVEPYRGGGTGQLNWSVDDLRALIERAEQDRHPTAIHAIGDRAIEQVIWLHERIGTSSDLRHRIEHFELPGVRHIERARDVGLTVCMQPNFIGNWSGPNSLYVDRFGTERDAASNPLRRIVDEELSLAFGSDGMPVGPLYGLHSAVNAPYPGQRLAVDEALACYTEAPARLAYEESRKGRLEIGMLADLVVLDEDPAERPEAIADRTVEMTFVGGSCVFKREGEPK